MMLPQPTSITQHLIDPAICIRCNSCEESCPIGAITHDHNNYVVDVERCSHCRACIPPCPTGAINHWYSLQQPYTLEQQLSWQDLPPPTQPSTEIRATEGPVSVRAPASASAPALHLYSRAAPAVATVKLRQRATALDADDDVWHIVLDFGDQSMPVLEGQSIGILPPGIDANGRPHIERLYSVASARTGERRGTSTVALTVRRKPGGLCSNYLCDLVPGETVRVVGPLGDTFLLPMERSANLIMVCTGTGVAPFRGFIQHRLRSMRDASGSLMLFFGGRRPVELPYSGEENGLPEGFVEHYFCFSRQPNEPRMYVQDGIRAAGKRIRTLLQDELTHVFLCGRKGMETGVEEAFADVLRGDGTSAWPMIRESLLTSGRYHVETY
ncbi:4Fe-4S binding protein (plasmid) [Cupriavidus sp. KK10]|jgi:benzoyl-CoA 2,3-dioxygenase component A|uniref:4Fe-4S binding protein n=1 Tax=Cupriavidus sp. KK10 TaxID=1478019 RepID=UPI001BA7DF31|nr:4Fe-4S binding protein [Cupriavidus sp. KK10]QUN32385.1 4Fe-4S binding protein [Cupriavidus sp. KK10]